jgi:ornithine--oxo-acid transaminase
MELNDRYLNPQLGRIVRTLGFDREWTRGEGAHLIDAEGNALPRPAVRLRHVRGRAQPSRRDRRAARAARRAHRANLPQLGVSCCPACSRRQLVARAPERIAAMVTANTGTEAVEGAIKLARAATGRPRILYASHAFHGLTLGSLSLNGDEQFREGFGPLLPGCDERPLRRPRRALRASSRGDVAAFIVEPIQGKGVNLPPDGYLAGAQAPAASTARCSSATRCRPASGAPGGSSRSSTGASTRT